MLIRHSCFTHTRHKAAMEIKDLRYDERPFKVNFYPGGNFRSSVLIAPAMGITAKYYHHLASWLAEQGYSVVVIDYQGTGMSENLIKQAITFNDWIKNIEIAGQWLKQRNPHIPLVFLGHSIGSQLFGFSEQTELFDRAVFLASSTGYWKNGRSPEKWINYFLLRVVLPFSGMVWGYTHAKFFKQGENYPILPALQWRKWCLNKEYLRVDLIAAHHNNYHYFRGKITSVWFSDDPVANEITAPDLLIIYKRAKIKLVKINPSDTGNQKIGHSGFLSRKFNSTLWPQFLTYLDN